MSGRIIGRKVGSASGKFAPWGKNSFNVVFIVETTSPNDGPAVVKETPGLPLQFSSYNVGNDSDASAICKTLTVRQTGRLLWEVTASYSRFKSEQGEDEENPLLRTPEVFWSSMDITRVIEKDRDGNPIINRAGQPFDPPVEDEETIQILTIIRNESIFDHLLAKSYTNKVNADTFWGYPAEYALMKAPHARWGWENGVSFWQITYEIHFHPESWTKRLLNRGCKYITVDNKLEHVKDDYGNYSTVPAPLDTQGRMLSQADIWAGNVVWLEYKIKGTISFAPLMLG